MNTVGHETRSRRLSERQSERLRVVFRKEVVANFRLLAWLRTAAVALTAIWLIFYARQPNLAENLISCALFAALGWIYYALSANRPQTPWFSVFYPMIDALILIDNLLPIMPWNATSLPDPVVLRFGSFAYLFVPVALGAFFLAPWRTFWSAVATALVWGAAVGWILLQPGAFSVPDLTMIAREDPRRFLEVLLNPNFVDRASLMTDLFILLLVGGLLSVMSWRTRRLVEGQMRAERNRANLARYFSPQLIDQLQDMESPLSGVRTQPVAVLFADIVGFTRLSERLPPERVIELLRSFHRRMAGVVFENDGTLDKYIGDAVMATFGVPNIGHQDAVNALICARAMADELDRWSEKRLARGTGPIRVGIGVHYGPAVLGDIGDERRLEYAVIGDTVNVASRLERLTRVLTTDIVVSRDLVDAALRQAPEQATAALAGFTPEKPRKLRGRQEPISLWSYRRPGVAPSSGELAVS
ncbi:MAG TPA: adenylate/guanylate cyclase domain-containing protein [Alphaproteobacteria bacterium]|nr:adenylate/guanylate cyclase domain-containing protein [Alphaproteobacteria bacterium]